MKKIIITILIVLLLIAGGVLLFYSEQDTSDRSDHSTSTNKIEKDKMTEEQDINYSVINYLENSSLVDLTSSGNIFANYYKFTREGDKLFIWAYISEYYTEQEEIKQGAILSTPLIIYLDENNKAKDHWEPREGEEEYSQSIKEKFPREYQDIVLHLQSKNQNILIDLKKKLEKRAKKDLVLMKKEPDRTLSVGEVDTISLDANRTTGYKWHHNIEEKDIIEMVSDEYREEEQEEGVVGAGGSRIVEIKGIEKGITTIEFEYYREGEPEQIEKSKEVNIKVEEGEQVHYDFPDPDLEFISIKHWDVQVFDTPEDIPAEYERVEGSIECRATSTSETINDRKYCVKSSSEGATGEIRQKYTYATVKEGQLFTVGFTVTLPQCGNYDQQPRVACQEEKNEFEQDDLVSSVVDSIEY